MLPYVAVNGLRAWITAGNTVPPILLSGNHGEVDRWRRQEALRRTFQRRPDLLAGATLDDADRAYLAGLREADPPE